MLLRRHYIASFLYTVLILFTFTSCASDRFDESTLGTGYSPNPNKACYLSLRIESVDNWSQTRTTYDDSESDQANTGDFVHGDEDEHAIGTVGNFVIFFDEGGNFFSMDDLTLDKGHKDDPGHVPSIKDDENKEDENYIEALYTTKFYPKTDEATGEYLWPSSCLVVLNGENIKKIVEDELQKLNDEKTIDDVLGIVWGNGNPSMIGRYSGNDGKNYFTMTNSAYVDKDKDNVDKLQTTVKIGPEHYSGEERVDLHIHVERMAAKFSFKENDDHKDTHLYIPDDQTIVYCDGFTGTNDGDDANVAEKYAPILVEKKYQVQVTGWGINALETENHLFKKIKDTSDYFTNWNAPNYFRSYWSEDPHYDYDENDALKYPWQYRLAVNNPLDYYQEKYPIGGENKNYLRNYSFNELNGEDENGEVHVEENFKEDRVVYTPENTYDPTIYGYDLEKYFDSRTELLAGTHLIVCANLETNIEETDESSFSAKDVYRDRTGVFYKNQKECFWSLVRAFNLALQSNTNMKFRRYKWDANKGTYGIRHEALTIQNDHHIYNDTVIQWDSKVEEAMQIKYDDENAPSKDNKDYSGKYKEKLPENDQTYGEVTDIGIYNLYRKVGNEYKQVTYEYIMGLPDNTQFFIPATVKEGDGKVLPWLDGLTIRTENDHFLPIYYVVDMRYSYLTGEPVAVGKIQRNEPDDNDMKSLILEWMGAVDHFKDGKMYYAAPVMHNAAGTNAANPGTNGDYGVVRNNWYKFTLENVTKIGTSVDDPTEPIVPNKVKTNDQLNISIRILDWHPLQSTVPILQ